MKFKTREEADVWMLLVGAAIIGQRHEDGPAIADRTLLAWRERRSEIDEEEANHRRQFDRHETFETLDPLKHEGETA